MSPAMKGLRDLHDDILYYLIFVTIFVFYLLLISCYSNWKHFKYFSSHSLLEFFWTLSPAIILLAIAIPSLKLLFLTDEVLSPILSFKCKGNQWFWSYELYDDFPISFDSYTLLLDDLFPGQLRLFDVDSRVFLPILTPIRALITSDDVMHSWAIPSLGIKTDAIPGRLNQIHMFIFDVGTYYGMCSELCGTQHASMSIVIEALPLSDYISYILSHTPISYLDMSSSVHYFKLLLY